MTQNHCVICPGRNVETNILGMKNLDGLVVFFRTNLEKKIIIDTFLTNKVLVYQAGLLEFYHVDFAIVDCDMF